MQFKVGDRVRIVQTVNFSGIELRHLIGMEGIVEDIDADPLIGFETYPIGVMIPEANESHAFAERELELIDG